MGVTRKGSMDRLQPPTPRITKNMDASGQLAIKHLNEDIGLGFQHTLVSLAFNSKF